MSDLLVDKILRIRNSDGDWTDKRGVVDVKSQIRAEIALVLDEAAIAVSEWLMSRTDDRSLEDVIEALKNE